jgi:flagellar P-ring protein precursor FlgI
VAISHGALNIQIRSVTEVSQPLPFSETGQTVTTTQSDMDVYEQMPMEEGAPFGILEGEGATVEDLVQAFQAIDGGLTPRDLIAIFQALKEAGALKGELVIM